VKKILIVDDDPFILDIYSSCLKNEGYAVDMANNQQKAEEKIFSTYPDLIILDLNLDTSMPGPEGGLSILRRIKADPKSKNLRVIVSSNYSAKDYPEISKLSEMGVNKVFLKVENSPEELSKIVKEILK